MALSHSRLLAVVAVVLATTAAIAAAPTNASSRQRRSAAAGSIPFSDIDQDLLCPAQVVQDSRLGVFEVFCTEEARSKVFYAGGAVHKCCNVFVTKRIGDSDVDVNVGCVPVRVKGAIEEAKDVGTDV